MPCSADVALEQKLTYPAAGNRFAAQAHLGIDDDAKAKFLAELLQGFAIAFRAITKTKVRSLVDLSRVKSLGDNLARKVLWGGRCELVIKWKNEDSINPG